MAKQASDYQSIISELKQKVYKPVYFLTGNEPYFIDKIADYIVENLLDEAERDFNQTIVYGIDTNMEAIVSTAKRFPVMAERQLVVVREAQLMDAREYDKLEPYLNNPQKSTVLVFCYKYKTFDKRKKVASKISEIGVFFESKKLYDNKIPMFIQEYLKGKSVDIDASTAQLLAEYAGTSLENVTNELDKLILAKPASQNKITKELVEENIGISKEFNNFELLAALINRNVYKSNVIANYLGKNQKENPVIVTISTLFNFFANLMLVHYMRDKTESEIISTLKINPYFFKDYKTAKTNFNPRKTLGIISILREFDARSKGFGSRPIPADELLRELVYKILN